MNLTVELHLVPVCAGGDQERLKAPYDLAEV